MRAVSAPLMPVATLLIFGYRILQITEAAYYRWRNRFGGPHAP
ncbi:hypothetical protein [Nocardia sp. SYP-A9097]|nr:hypothetical protein [Nocardia sp. SYP-A9097]